MKVRGEFPNPNDIQGNAVGPGNRVRRKPGMPLIAPLSDSNEKNMHMF